MKAIAFVLAFASGHATAQASFVTIGDLPGSLWVCYAYGTNSDGTVVTGFSYSHTGIAAFRWTSTEGIVQLPSTTNTGSYQGEALSPDGQIILGRDGGLGALWSDKLGAISVGDVPGGADLSYIYDVSNDGTVVGKASHDFNPFNAPLYRAIRWTPAGGVEPLPLPNASDIDSSSAAWSILSDGRIFGVSASGAWLYSDSTGFEMLDGAERMTRSNPNATFLAGQATDPTMQAGVPAYWTPDAGLQYLPLLSADVPTPGHVSGMSDDGSVIVGKSGVHFVVWFDQGIPIRVIDYAASLGLDMDGWTILNVSEVSADGSTIVGGAKHASWGSNRVEGFVLRSSPPQPPCPADTNNDGTLSPADFTAWIAAFNSTSDACDQNNDGLCTPADFTAWIANYNAGC